MVVVVVVAVVVVVVLLLNKAPSIVHKLQRCGHNSVRKVPPLAHNLNIP